MTDKSNTQAADWLHLKPYGYAPGNYMSKCFGCKRVLPNLDKMASRCRPCAEALAAQPTPEPSFAGIAARKLDDLKAQGYAVDGYSIQHAETKQRGFITTGGFVGWWINTDHVQPGTEPVAQADEMDKLTLTITFDDDVDCSIEVFGTTKHLTRLKTWLERCDLANEAIAARASLPAGGVVELAEADRRAGAAERELAKAREDIDRFTSVRSKMKREAGYDDNVSFDLVWADVLAKSKGVPVPDDVLCAARWRWLAERYEVHFRDGRFVSLVNITSEQHRESLGLIVDQHMAGDWSAADTTPQPSETQGRRQMTDEMLKVLKGCRDEAMAKAASARVPECGDFGGIAQDLDWLVAELCPASPQAEGGRSTRDDWRHNEAQGN